MTGDLERELSELIRAAAADATPLQIVGGGSKAWYGRAPEGVALDVSGHAGILDYAPRELVVRARAGTPLAELEAVLAQAGQSLPFEPPAFGPTATLGGTLACGLSGPARPYVGSGRDHVLGARLVNGRGEALGFGGQVMKNVAGYDVSRLMVGALGTLGLLLDVSLKVLPKPETHVTLVKECNPREAIAGMNGWAGKPIPLSATCFDGNRMIFRLSGTETAVQHAAQRLGGDALPEGDGFWADLREHRHAFFAGDGPVWRVSLPSATPHLDLPGKWLIEWGGGQRWLRGEVDPVHLRATVQAAGGHVTLFRGGDRTGEVFQPLSPALMAVHRRLKQAFDPVGLFNPGRMYREL